jgi:hypothetical protein
LVNTAKLHSELFVKVSTQLLYNKPITDTKTRTIVSRKRKEARKRKPKRPVFDKLDNIYRPKAYKPKMMAQPLVEKPLGEKGVAEWSENLNMTAICKDCKEFPPNLVEEFSSGDLVCGSCGLVIGDRIVDTRSEWRTFANDDGNNDDPSRVGDGANPLLNGSQLTTQIAYGDGSRSHDLHRAHGRSTADKATKSLLAAYKEIGAHCDAVNIPKNVSDTAKHLYKLVDDAKAFKGKSQEAIIAGCIFIACRQCGVPRTFREIYALTKVSKKDIGRTFKALEKFFAEDSKDKVSVTVGGKSNVCDINCHSILTVFLKGPKTNTRPLPRPMLRIFASATAVSLVSKINSLLRFPKGSLTRCPLSVISPVDLLCQSQLPASIWPRTCSASQSPQKRSQVLLASAMVPFALPTSTCIRNGKGSLNLSGLQMARETWITFLWADG